MNRKTSIIICVTCIAIIIISLLGITYGFYITKVFGNETAKSVVVTTADSKVTFRDLSDANETYSLGVGESFTKTFTVENTGQGSADYYVALTNITNNFNRKEDVRYTLYRVGYNNGETELDFPENLSECTTKANDTFTTSCTNVVNDGQYPGENSIISPKEVLPSTGNIYKYLLVVTYINQPYINQDLDKDAYVSGKVQISATEDISNVKELLVDKIIANAKSGIEGRSVYTEPEDLPTTPAEDVSGENERILSYVEDDYTEETGEYSYYFRGNVEDNYVNFNDMCWRIVRIEGDGSIKLVLEDQYDTCEQDTDTDNDSKTYTGDWNIGYAAYGYIENDEGQLFADYENYSGGMKDKLNSWLTGTLSDDTLRFSTENQNKLKSTKVCIGNTENAYDNSTGALLTQTEKQSLIEEWELFYYKNGVRLYGKGVTPYATYLCDEYGKSINEYKIYPLTADEVIFAGGKAGASNQNYYLKNSYYWWTLSPSRFDGIDDVAFYVDNDGNVNFGDVNHDFDLRPAISILESSAIYNGGEGTLESPYIIG